MRSITNLFLVVLIGVTAIDTMPFEPALRSKVDTVLDKTGLWQGTWRLFAPNPDRENSYVSAVIAFEDGAAVVWRSPDWSAMTPWQHFRYFRHAEYYDNIRVDDYSVGWDALASYLARNAVHPVGSAAPAVSVILTRHWATMPTPTSTTLLPAGPYLDFAEPYPFHTWTLAGAE